MVHVPYILTALAAGFPLRVLANREWTQSTATVCAKGIRPRDTLPGRWEIINGSLWSAPSAASWGPNRLDVVGWGPDNQLVHRSGDGCVWTDWEDLGNLLTTEAKAIGWRGNRLDVFARGLDGSVNAITYLEENAGWGGWYSLGSGRLSTDGVRSAASPVSWGMDRLDVFVSDAYSVLNQIYYSAETRTWSAWTAHTDLPPVLQGLNPVAVTRGQGLLDVFYLHDGTVQLIHAYTNGGAWAYEALGGPFLVDPAAIALGPSSLFVFEVAYDHLVYYRRWDGTAWTPWQPLPGVQVDQKPIAVVSDRPDTFDLYVLDTDNVLRHKQWTAAGGWRPGDRWEIIDGPTWLEVPAVTSWGPGNIDIFAVDRKHTVWHNW
ncbi:hypothetical protein QBC43DRAFT_372985 [Cladorrhinum sp. PSN259]|nr:hypothetical protein QBC43DRAFT_372985 [Cladorrhinum sp. PSN259]